MLAINLYPMRHASFLLPVLLLGACTLISPYSITFTNTPDSVIDPSSSTLDFVVSAPTLAYISGVSCEGAEPLEILPVESKDLEVNTVHKLPLSLLKDQPTGAKCEITVTAYDRTTTDRSSQTIELTMNGIPLSKEGAMCGGIAVIQCAEGLTCDMPENPTTSDASGTCVVTDTSSDKSEEDSSEDSAVENTDEASVETTETVESTVTTDTSVDSSTSVEVVPTEQDATDDTVDTTTTPVQ